MKMYGIRGRHSGELMTWSGRVIVHDNKDEMQFIFEGADIVEVPRSIEPELMISIKHHPDFGSYQWPLEMNVFR